MDSYCFHTLHLYTHGESFWPWRTPAAVSNHFVILSFNRIAASVLLYMVLNIDRKLPLISICFSAFTSSSLLTKSNAVEKSTKQQNGDFFSYILDLTVEDNINI